MFLCECESVFVGIYEVKLNASVFAQMQVHFVGVSEV